MRLLDQHLRIAELQQQLIAARHAATEVGDTGLTIRVTANNTVQLWKHSSTISIELDDIPELIRVLTREFTQ